MPWPCCWPGPARAALRERAGGKYEQATFKAEIKGVQTYANEYHHASTGPCDPRSTGSRTRGEVREQEARHVHDTKIPELKGRRDVRHEAPAVPDEGEDQPSTATPHPDPRDCGGNGGGVPAGRPTAARRRSAVDVRRLLQARAHRAPAGGQRRGDPYENCGSGSSRCCSRQCSASARPPSCPGGGVQQGVRKDHHDRRRRRGFVWPEGFSETKVRWELSLTRVKPGNSRTAELAARLLRGPRRFCRLAR